MFFQRSVSRDNVSHRDDILDMITHRNTAFSFLYLLCLPHFLFFFPLFSAIFCIFDYFFNDCSSTQSEESANSNCTLVRMERERWREIVIQIDGDREIYTYICPEREREGGQTSDVLSSLSAQCVKSRCSHLKQNA